MVGVMTEVCQRCGTEIGSTAEEPTEPGWYTYSGGAEVMIFHLRAPGQWSVHLDNGSVDDCAWGYIEQALDVWDLVPLAAVACRVLPHDPIPSDHAGLERWLAS